MDNPYTSTQALLMALLTQFYLGLTGGIFWVCIFCMVDTGGTGCMKLVHFL